jgi:hypothetical protein
LSNSTPINPSRDPLTGEAIAWSHRCGNFGKDAPVVCTTGCDTNDAQMRTVALGP